MLIQMKEVDCPKLISRKTLKINWNKKSKTDYYVNNFNHI